MKNYCFTVDDNILFLRDLNSQEYNSIFEHPYLAVYKYLHDNYGVKVQLNLFYKTDDFDLSQMTDRYKKEWQDNCFWLKLSFHGKEEEKISYENVSYSEMKEEVEAVNREIIRFAGKSSLARTTTVHYCNVNKEGIKALRDSGYNMLLGLFGSLLEPRTSYGLSLQEAAVCRKGILLLTERMKYMSIDMVLNTYKREDILSSLGLLSYRENIRIMIHEQYFYKDYKLYQPDFKEKIETAVGFLSEQGYASSLAEEMIA